MKIRFEEYVRLHRIITHTSSKVVWEYLKDNKPIEALLDKVPDEFYSWVKEKVSLYRQKFSSISEDCRIMYKQRSAVHQDETQKEYAMWAQKHPYPHLLFALRNGKDITPMVWKLIKPKHELPFKNIEA